MICIDFGEKNKSPKPLLRGLEPLLALEALAEKVEKPPEDCQIIERSTTKLSI